MRFPISFLLSVVACNASVIYSFSDTQTYLDDAGQNQFTGTVGFTLTEPDYIKTADFWTSTFSSCSSVYSLPCSSLDLTQDASGVTLNFELGNGSMSVFREYPGFTLQATLQADGVDGELSVVDPPDSVPEPSTLGLTLLALVTIYCKLYAKSPRLRNSPVRTH